MAEHQFDLGQDEPAREALRAGLEFAAHAPSEIIDIWLERLRLKGRITAVQYDDSGLSTDLRALVVRARTAGLAAEALAATLLYCRAATRAPLSDPTVEAMLDDLLDAAERGPMPWLGADVLMIRAEATLAGHDPGTARRLAEEASQHATAAGSPEHSYGWRLQGDRGLLERCGGGFVADLGGAPA